MTKFFSSPFFAHETARYGKPNSLFESLQVLFSHLVLHPCCEFAITMPVSRGDYDLSIVYLFEKGLETIYQRGASSLAHPGHQQMLLKLDLNALLHIRNFWHSHLVQRQTEKYADAVQTYGEMARSLVKRDHAPRGWNRPIQESLGLLPSWFGHYSCTHPAPKKLIDIEEHQSCAEDWVNQFGTNGVHPLTLNMTTTSSPARGWWPPIFSSVPILESTTPEAKPGSGHLYLRGIAPFLSPLKHPDMYPAYTALRIRGVIHTLPDQEEIPGWRRIVMVLYKPTSRYLLSVLDENSPDEEDDNPFDQIDQLATLLQPAQSVGQDPGQAQASAQDSAQVQVQTQTQAEPTAQEQPQILPADAEAEEKIMKEQLEARDELKGPVGPVYLTRDFIAEMEDKLHPPEELAWEDINYAYVYEGVIIPGGMIMMGRYWRFGPPTAAIGFEQGEGADRGPFVFWC